MKWILVAALCAGVCSARAQTILGKHPADKITPGFLTQNSNAQTIATAVQPYLTNGPGTGNAILSSAGAGTNNTLYSSTLKSASGSPIFTAQRVSGANAFQIQTGGEMVGFGTNDTLTLLLDPNRGDVAATRLIISSMNLTGVGGINSGTNSIRPTTVFQPDGEHVAGPPVAWNSHIAETYTLSEYCEHCGGEGDDIYIFTNAYYGLIFDADSAHILSITNLSGAEVAYSQTPLTVGSPAQFITNGFLSDLYLSYASNEVLSAGFTVKGPLNADGASITNIKVENVDFTLSFGHPRIAYDGLGISNAIPPANWGSALCPYPQFGWNSYLQQGCGGVNENSCIAIINWMTNRANGVSVVDAGPEGSTWLWIDCGWSTNALSNTNSQFPNGVTNIVKMAHANKIKVGIYAGVNGGPFGPAITVANAFNVISNFARLQVDGFKLDGDFSDQAVPGIEGHIYGSRILANAILGCTRFRDLTGTRTNMMLLDYTLHDSDSVHPFPPLGSTPPEVFANTPMWEVTTVQELGDVNRGLQSADLIRPLLAYQQPGRFGQLLFGNEQGGVGSNSELTNSANMNLTFPGFVHIGITNALATSLWTNREMRSILHDPYVSPSREIYSNAWWRIWARPIGGKWGGDKYLLCFINGQTNGAANTNMSVSAASLGWTNGTAMLAHDPYQQRDIGVSNSTFTATVTTNQSCIWVLSRASGVDVTQLPTNLQQWNATGTNYWTPTNTMTTTVDFKNSARVTGDMQVSGALTFAGFTGLSTTQYQTAVIYVFNTAGTAAGITAPANCHTNNDTPANVTNLTAVMFQYRPPISGAGAWTNMLTRPLW